MPGPTTIERAYELARSGECANLAAIRKRLLLEGRSDERWQITGKTLTLAPTYLCRVACGEPRFRGAVADQQRCRKME